MAAFTDFFAAKTGKKWENRLDGIPMAPKQDVDGKELPAHAGWFYYETGRSLLSDFLRQGESQVLQWARVPCKLLSARTVMTMVL